jgi:hypothetical protein
MGLGAQPNIFREKRKQWFPSHLRRVCDCARYAGLAENAGYAIL